jgi:hypothetical protein
MRPWLLVIVLACCIHGALSIACPTSLAWPSRFINDGLGVSVVSAVTCGGHGTCNTGTGVCTCNSLYTGTACENGPCGASHTDVQCSGYGYCGYDISNNPGFCVCNQFQPLLADNRTFPTTAAFRDQFRVSSGLSCELDICNQTTNINSGRIGVYCCPGGLGYYGSQLKYMSCSGHSDLGCLNSGHNNGTCQCASGYEGNACQWDGPCSSNATLPLCSGRGTCGFQNTVEGIPFGISCVCQGNYTGINCELDTCGTGSACGGQGVCTNGACVCNSTWQGAQCQFSVCTNTTTCNGEPCTNSVCACPPYRSGLFCENHYCGLTDNCNGNGVCGNSSGCACYSNFAGSDCSQCSVATQSICNGFGTFNCSTNQCLCTTTGFVQSSNCTSCNTGFAGLNCNIPQCGSNLCGGNGVCTLLDPPFFNEPVSEFVNGMLFLNDANGTRTYLQSDCWFVPGTGNNVVRCHSMSKCLCNNGFSGVNCSTSVQCYAPGTQSTTTICNCKPGYSGTMCEHNCTVNQCSGNGLCVNSTCQCNPTAAGGICERATGCSFIGSTYGNLTSCTCKAGFMDRYCCAVYDAGFSGPCIDAGDGDRQCDSFGFVGTSGGAGVWNGVDTCIGGAYAIGQTIGGHTTNYYNLFGVTGYSTCAPGYYIESSELSLSLCCPLSTTNQYTLNTVLCSGVVGYVGYCSDGQCFNQTFPPATTTVLTNVTTIHTNPATGATSSSSSLTNVTTTHYTCSGGCANGGTCQNSTFATPSSDIFRMLGFTDPSLAWYTISNLVYGGWTQPYPGLTNSLELLTWFVTSPVYLLELERHPTLSGVTTWFTEIVFRASADLTPQLYVPDITISAMLAMSNVTDDNIRAIVSILTYGIRLNTGTHQPVPIIGNGPYVHCRCPVGTAGASCDTNPLLISTLNGEICTGNWLGQFHGIYDGVSACVCDHRYIGLACDIYIGEDCFSSLIDTNPCGGHGTCTSNSTGGYSCVCNTGRVGATCEWFVCSFSDTPDQLTIECNNLGNCPDSGVCNCFALGAQPATTSVTSTPPILPIDTNCQINAVSECGVSTLVVGGAFVWSSCNGKGLCNVNSSIGGQPYCTCDNGFDGAKCTNSICGSPGCNTHELCDEQDGQCGCTTMWSTTGCSNSSISCRCQQSLCVNGVPASDGTTCVCNNGYRIDTNGHCTIIQCPLSIVTDKGDKACDAGCTTTTAALSHSTGCCYDACRDGSTNHNSLCTFNTTGGLVCACPTPTAAYSQSDGICYSKCHDQPATSDGSPQGFHCLCSSTFYNNPAWNSVTDWFDTFCIRSTCLNGGHVASNGVSCTCVGGYSGILCATPPISISSSSSASSSSSLSSTASSHTSSLSSSTAMASSAGSTRSSSSVTGTITGSTRSSSSSSSTSHVSSSTLSSSSTATSLNVTSNEPISTMSGQTVGVIVGATVGGAVVVGAAIYYLAATRAVTAAGTVELAQLVPLT